MRIRAKVTVKLFEDTTEKNGLLVPDDEAAEVILDGPQEANVIRADIAAAATLTVPLGSVGTVTGLFLKSTGDFDLVLNGGSTLQVRREQTKAGVANKASTVKFYFEGTVTSVVITALTSAISVTGALWGDSTP